MKGELAVCVPAVGGLVVPKYTVYPALPLTGFQLKDVVTGTMVATLPGEINVGAGNPAEEVVKDQVSEGFSVLLLFGSRLATFQ